MAKACKTIDSITTAEGLLELSRSQLKNLGFHLLNALVEVSNHLLGQPRLNAQA